MKTHLFVIIGLLSYVTTGFAALPPLYQSAKELKTILDSSELADELSSGDVIESIDRNESGYEVRTQRAQLQVDVIYQPQDMPGPVPFKLHFHKASQE